jgi:uncharacterized membrane protein
MTSLNLLVLGHILGTVVLVGGAFMLQMLAVLAARSPAAADLAALSRQAAWIGPRVFLPAAVLIAATGAGMASRLGVALDEPFVLTGLVVIVIAAVTGPAYLAPESRRISRLLAAEGPRSAEARRRLRRLFLASRIELVLLVIAVAAMVVGPAL